MCVWDWRVNKKKERWRQKWEAEEPVSLSGSRSRSAHSTEEIRTGHAVQWSQGSTSQITLIHILPQSDFINCTLPPLSCKLAVPELQSKQCSSYSCCMELFPLSFACLPHWEMLLKEIFWGYGNKARYSSGQTGSFLRRGHRTAKVRDTVVGKACDRGEKAQK